VSQLDKEQYISGKWWKPGFESSPIHGTLYIAEDDHFLTLSMPSEAQLTEYDTCDVINGVCANGRSYSLVGCFSVGNSRSNGIIGDIKIFCHFVVDNFIIKHKNDAFIKRTTPQIENFGAWKCETGVKIKQRHVRRPRKLLDLSYSLPQERTYGVDSLKKVNFSANFSYSPRPNWEGLLTFKERHSASISYRRSVDLFQALDDCSIFRSFLSFSSQMNCYFSRIEVKTKKYSLFNGKRMYKTATIKFISSINKESGSVHPTDNIVRYADIAEDSDIFCRWWDFFNKYAVVSVYDSIEFGQGIRDEAKFLFLIQAIEEVHKRDIHVKQFDEHAFGEFVERFQLLLEGYNGFSASDKRLLLSKIQYMNELSLRDRISFFIDRYGKVIHNHCMNIVQSNDMVRIRNRISHGGAYSLNAEDSEKLNYGINQLLLVIECIILDKIGFNIDQINTQIAQSVKIRRRMSQQFVFNDLV